MGGYEELVCKVMCSVLLDIYSLDNGVFGKGAGGVLPHPLTLVC